MKAWRSHRWLAVALAAWPFSLGCQAREVQPSAAGITPDFGSLVSMAGATSPARQMRGQKDANDPGLLVIRHTDPGTRENRSARIRAVVNGEAILDEEVVAAAYQQLVGARTEKEKADLLDQKLTELIDREVVLQDAVARLGNRGNGKIIKELQGYAEKEFERQWLHRMMRANKFEDPATFKQFLKDNGMPLDMVKRQWERNFIAMEYMRSRIEPHLNRIGHLQVAEYYEKHGNEFTIEDSLVWQDLFIANATHATPQAARQFAEALLARIRKGEDFAKLAKQYDNGDSSLRDNAEGIGRKRGDIKPAEAEPVLMNMKPGQSALVELSFGYHIVKLTEREHAGRRPFDEKVQKEIKDKLRNDVFTIEMKRLVNDLKRRAIIEIASEIK